MFDETNAFDGFDCRINKFFVASCQCKCQCVVDQIFGLESVVVDGNVVDAFGDFEFFLAGLRHAVFVNRQNDDGGIMFFCKFENFIGLGAA